MQEKDLQGLKNKLLKEKKRLEDEYRSLQGDMKQNQAGWSGEHGYENHLADIGTDTASREADLSLEFNVKDMLDHINDALKRMDEGTYGVCSICGKAIPMQRLKAIPWATLCIEDKKREEMLS
ncbi:MAG: TraR/DksA family transcriptional regulator [Candidatus Aquicultorales bacterium]